MAKASDFSKRLKAIHLGGVARELTVRQIGVEKQQKRNKQEVTIFASDGSADNEAQTENVVYVWFKELPITRNMRVNETNLTAMIEALGEDFRAWIGAKVTLTPQEIFAFGKRQQTIVITKITPAPKQPAEQKSDTQTTQPTNGNGARKPDPSTQYYTRAKELGIAEKSAAQILNSHKNDIGGYDWKAATLELEAAMQPA